MRTGVLECVGEPSATHCKTKPAHSEIKFQNLSKNEPISQIRVCQNFFANVDGEDRSPHVLVLSTNPDLL